MAVWGYTRLYCFPYDDVSKKKFITVNFSINHLVGRYCWLLRTFWAQSVQLQTDTEPYKKIWRVLSNWVRFPSMIKLEKWCFESETHRIWNRIPTNMSSESMNYGHRMNSKHQKCTTIHHKTLWMAGTNWIVIVLLFWDFQFQVVGMDLLRKHKGIIPLRQLLHEESGRKSVSVARIPPNFFLRLRIPVHLLLKGFSIG